MGKDTREYYSFVPTDKAKTLACIEEKYGAHEESKEEYVERYYKGEDNRFIKVYKDKCENGIKVRNGKILMYGLDEDYQELREKDMRLNGNPVEESGSPLISDLNFKYKTIGSDETGKGEMFKYLVVTAAYVDGENDVKRFIKLGVDDSKEISDKIASIGKAVTGISSWEELLEKLNEKQLFVTDCSVTKIITNEEYNERCCENGENVNEVIKKAHLEVLREAYKIHPGSMIVVDNFYDKSQNSIVKFKEELSSGDSTMDSDHVFMTVQADSKIMAVSLASVISAYICDLGFDYVQGIFDDCSKNTDQEIHLPKGSSLSIDKLADFFSNLKPDQKDEFINKYAKKFNNVQKAIKKVN